MSVFMEQSKQARPKRAVRAAIFSAKKKTKRVKKRRYVLIAVILLIVLALAVLLLIRLLSKGTWGVAPVPPVSPLVGSPATPDEIESRIAALNEEITGALFDIGLSPDSITKRTENKRSGRNIEYVQIEEDYAVPKGLRSERVRKYLEDYVGDFRGVLSEETTEAARGGFVMTVYAYGVPIRTLTFPAEAGTAPPVTPPRVKLPKVAIIIDDMGADKKALSDILSLKYSVTISVFPFLEYSTETADLAHKKGREVMLHLPMEPIDYPKYNPGKGALFTFMTADEFRTTLSEDLSAVPYISGVNNHMGSALTQDREKMEIVLAAVKERGLFFVDSRTIPKSVAYDVAVKLGVPAVERNVFLDNDASVESVKKMIGELIEKAKANGKALAICHPRPGTIKALKQMEKRLTGSEVEVVPVSDLLKK
jgi:polysaccharide deacetylase 2 family uncharacterized protein YibQ